MSMSLVEIKAGINTQILRAYRNVDEGAQRWQAAAPAIEGIFQALDAVAVPCVFDAALHTSGVCLSAWPDGDDKEAVAANALEEWADGADFGLYWNEIRGAQVCRLIGRDDFAGCCIDVLVMPQTEVSGHGI